MHAVGRQRQVQKPCEDHVWVGERPSRDYWIRTFPCESPRVLMSNLYWAMTEQLFLEIFFYLTLGEIQVFLNI